MKKGLTSLLEKITIKICCIGIAFKKSKYYVGNFITKHSDINRCLALECFGKLLIYNIIFSIFKY